MASTCVHVHFTVRRSLGAESWHGQRLHYKSSPNRYGLRRNRSSLLLWNEILRKKEQSIRLNTYSAVLSH